MSTIATGSRPLMLPRPRPHLHLALLGWHLALAVLAGVSFVRYLGPEPDRFLTFGPIDTYQAGQVIHYPDGRIFLIVDDPARRDGFRAFKDTDPRNGCPLRWFPNERRFFDLCHHSMYDRNGRILAGPARWPLAPLRVRVDDVVRVERPPITQTPRSPYFLQTGR